MNSIKEINIDTLARDNIISNIGQELMDLDLISNKVMKEIPQTSWDISYKLELKFNLRVYIFLLFLGFLMIMSVVLTTF